KQGIDRPLTPIGHGTQMQQGIGEDPPPARGYGRRHRFGGQTFLERLPGHDHLHHSSNRLSSHTQTIPTTPWTQVAHLRACQAVATFSRLNWVTTQKKLSLAWDTVMPPAPMAMTVSTRPISLSRPSWPSIGATSAEVVTRATVVDPWAVFSAAATIKGMNRPMPSADRVWPR